MGKFIGNRIGYANTTGGEGGVFDIFGQFYLSKISKYLPFVVTSNAGSISTAGGYTTHTFTSSGSITVQGGSLSMEYLVIGGGGSGSGSYPGANAGGGAGGYRTGSGQPLVPGQYSIQVGNGGARGGAFHHEGNQGTASYISYTSDPNVLNIVSQGGGGGGGGGSANVPGNGYGRPGGSGGGGSVERPGAAGIGTGSRGDGTNLPLTTPVPSQGNNGGQAVAHPGGNGGGGGAGGAGGNASPTIGGAGGNGLTSTITGSPVARGGGGSGGGSEGSGNPHGPSTAGANPGFTPGGNAASFEGKDGNANTGAGGGGGYKTAGGSPVGGGGGSGIVVIKYQNPT